MRGASIARAAACGERDRSCRAYPALQSLLDDSNGVASQCGAIGGDVIAGLGDALSCGEDIERWLADADPDVLCAVPAARMGAAVRRCFAIQNVRTIAVAWNNVDGFARVLAIVRE